MQTEAWPSPNTFTPEVAMGIRAAVAAYLRDPVRPSLRPIVLATGALPIYTDIGGSILLSPDGTFLSVIDGADSTATPEIDPKWQLVALVVGAEAYPALRSLLPVRIADDEPCEACDARGRVLLGHGVTPVCAMCAGLGWRRAPAA